MTLLWCRWLKGTAVDYSAYSAASKTIWKQKQDNTKKGQCIGRACSLTYSRCKEAKQGMQEQSFIFVTHSYIYT